MISLKLQMISQSKQKADLIRRNANVSIIRDLIGNVLIYNKVGNTEQDLFDYKDDFEKLEGLCMS